MKQLLTLAIVIILVTTQTYAQESPYKITADAKIKKEDEQDKFLCMGKTELPSGSVLTVSVYYEKTLFNRELASQKITVDNGNFAVSFKIFKNKTFPGTYIFIMKFEPYNQPASVREKLEDDFRPYSEEITLKVGTDKKVEEAKSLYTNTLISSIKELNDIRLEIDTIFKEMIKKCDQEKWTKSIDTWKKKISGLSDKNNASEFEYRILLISGTADRFKTMSVCILDDIITKCTEALKSEKSDLSLIGEINNIHYSYEKYYKNTLEELGLTKVSQEEIQKTIDTAKSICENLIKWYELFIKGDKEHTTQKWQSWKEEWYQDFTTITLHLMDVIPDKAFATVAEFTQLGDSLYNEISESIKSNIESKKISEFNKQLDSIIKKLLESTQ